MRIKQHNLLFFILLFTCLFISCEEKGDSDNPSQKEIISWEVGNSIPTNFPIDQLPGIDFYQNKMYFLGGNGTMWNNADDPRWNGWELKIGDNVDDLSPVAPQPIMAKNFPDLNTDEAKNDWCYYWLMGLWIDQSDGTFYSMAYSEYNYQESKWEKEAKERRLGLAKSIDKGSSWTYEGDVITQDKSVPPPAGTQYNGVGDICMFIPGDGYIYIYYKKSFHSLETLDRTEQSICVARCEIKNKQAPEKWFKFYEGGWNEPGLGGSETTIIPYTNIITITYNEYLKKFVGIGNSPAGKTFITFADSMEKQDWSTRDFSFPDITFWYNWQINSDKKNPYIMGQEFRLYTTGVDSQGKRPSNYYKIKFNKQQK